MWYFFLHFILIWKIVNCDRSGRWFSPGIPVSREVGDFLRIFRFRDRSVIFSGYSAFARGRCFSPGIPVSSTIKTDRHDIIEILLKVALNTISQTNQKYWKSITMIRSLYPREWLYYHTPVYQDETEQYSEPFDTKESPLEDRYLPTTLKNEWKEKQDENTE